jgi:hypothetical protein
MSNVQKEPKVLHSQSAGASVDERNERTLPWNFPKIAKFPLLHLQVSMVEIRGCGANPCRELLTGNASNSIHQANSSSRQQCSGPALMRTFKLLGAGLLDQNPRNPLECEINKTQFPLFPCRSTQ